MLKVTRNSKVLFIGDSITDCGRINDPEQMGTGYPKMIKEYLLAKDPANAPLVINRGISGNKVTDLDARWQSDVIGLSPDVLSIKIGINDVWHGLADPARGVSVDQFKEVYSKILSEVRATVPQCAIVLCEPSVIWPPSPAEGNDRLKPYVAAVNELAREFGALCVVPLHGAFINAQQSRPDVAWTTDGVHPTSVGHTLIARTWLSVTGLL